MQNFPFLNAILAKSLNSLNGVQRTDQEKFTRKSVIGKGPTGTVYKVTNKDNNNYALKEILSISNHNEIVQMINHIEILGKYKHKFLLEFFYYDYTIEYLNNSKMMLSLIFILLQN